MTEDLTFRSRPQVSALVGILLSALGGVFYFVGFVGFGVYPLIFLFMVPTVLALRGTRLRRAFAFGWVTGLVANMGGYYWVVHLLENFANLNKPLAILGFTLLCAYQGASIGFVAMLVRMLERDVGVHPAFGLPLAYAVVEFIYPFVFPSYVGNALYEISLLTQIVEVFGMLSLTIVVCLVSGAIYELIDSRLARRRVRRSVLVSAAILLAATATYGAIRMSQLDASISSLPTIKTAVIQTNLGAKDKSARRDLFIERHRKMTIKAQQENPEIELFVWPESAYNRWIPRTTKNLGSSVTAGIERPLVFGALTFEKDPTQPRQRAIYNTAVATSSTGDVKGLFDKVELLVFGETIPLVETFPQIRDWFPRSSVFTRGTIFRHFRVAGTVLSPSVCYEDLIPRFVRRMWVEDGPAEVLVNVTNDSWYGDTHEPIIHLALATFRTIETRRSMIRSTNTGISAIIDPAGRITHRTGQWTQEVLIADVPLDRSGSTTVYMWWGDVLGIGLLLYWCGASIIAILRRRRD